MSATIVPHGKLEHIIAKSTDEFLLYKEEYNKIGYPVELWYLRKCDKVRGFYKNGEFCGGYVLNSTYPYRYFEVLPDKVMDKIPPLEDLIEVCCLWFCPHVTKKERAYCYLMLLIDFLLSGKKYLVGGCLNPKIARIQNWALPHPIYQGETVAGKTTFNYYGSKWDMIKCAGKIIKVLMCGSNY